MRGNADINMTTKACCMNVVNWMELFFFLLITPAGRYHSADKPELNWGLLFCPGERLCASGVLAATLSAVAELAEALRSF